MRGAAMVFGLVLLAAPAALAAPGALDPSFDGDGKTTTNLRSDVPNSAPAAVALQPDGKIVSAGGAFLLARHNPDGSLDTAFGSGGRVLTGIAGDAGAMALQPDGKIVVAGRARGGDFYDFAVARFTQDGRLDSAFGTQGLATARIGSYDDFAWAIAVQSDGRLVAAGDAQKSSGGTTVAVARFNPDGSLDASFGSGGTLTTAVGNSTDQARAVALQADGRILVAGSTAGSTGFNFALLRYDEAGVLDPSFDGDGKVVSVFPGGQATLKAMALLADGRFVAAGTATGDFVLARYDANGALDPSFGSGGWVTADLSGSFDSAEAVVPLADGRILAGGYAMLGGKADLALARFATDGSLDATFGVAGVVTRDLAQDDDYVVDLALQGDGSAIAAGVTYTGIEERFVLARLDTNGAFDPSFDGDGISVSDIGPSDDHARAMAVQADGRITVAGYADGNFHLDVALARYLPDGRLDPSFGIEGRVITKRNGKSNAANALLRQGDGKLVVAGYVTNTAGDTHVGLFRYLADGSLDPTFGTGGAVTTAVGTNSIATGLAQQSDGKLVVVGPARIGANLDFLVARYNQDGSLDPTFSGDGVATTPVGTGDDWASALAIQPDGKVVVAGYAANLGTDDFALVRYRPDGSLDPTFDGDGKVLTAVDIRDDRAWAIALLSDGKILVAGQASVAGGDDFALLRYNPNGSLDTTFDGDGKVTTAIGSSHDRAYALAVQADGKVILGGESWSGSVVRFAVARYNADGGLDTSFDGDGKLTTVLSPFPLATPFGDSIRAVATDTSGGLIAAGDSPQFGTYSDFAVARYFLSQCGDGAVGPGETCDDGNLAAGDCCSPTCQFDSAVMPCADDGMVCTADHCNGAGQCVHTPGNPGAPCRPAIAACDAPEVCDGVSSACPADGFAAPTVTCRPSAGPCDPPEACTGSAPECPSDTKSTSECRPAATICDAPESCDGVGDSCPPDAPAAAGLECRPSAGACDVPETCDGSSLLCPQDTYAAAGSTCRLAAGPCDVTETCTGTAPGCPGDAKSTGECRPAASICDAPEICDGVGNSCPPDAPAAAGIVCRPSAGTCDVVETCDGSSHVCPPDVFSAAGSSCRAAVGLCDVAETCTGSSAACPSDDSAPDGTPCSDGVFCNGAESCRSGSCATGTPPCTAACDETGQVCWSCPIVPRQDCHTAQRETLVLRSPAGGERRLLWRWLRGEATAHSDFADPRAQARYSLCLYEGPGDALAAQILVPADAGRWRARGAAQDRGFVYRDSTATADGAKSIALRPGGDGTVRIAIAAKGAALPDAMLPLDLPIRVQLYNSESGMCWSGGFTSTLRNDAGALRAAR